MLSKFASILCSIFHVYDKAIDWAVVIRESLCSTANQQAEKALYDTWKIGLWNLLRAA